MMMPDVRLTHVRVMILEVLAPGIYRLETVSPCQAEKPIHSRSGSMLQRVEVLLVVIIRRRRLLPTEFAIVVLLLSGLLLCDLYRLIP